MPVAEGVLKNISGKIIKIIIFFLILAVFNSFLQVFVILQSQEIEKLQSQIEHLKRDISRTKVEIASLKSFDRIQSIALNELGMRTADFDDYHWVEALPTPGDSLPEPDLEPQLTVKAGFWEQLHLWIGDIGKTMARSL